MIPLTNLKSQYLRYKKEIDRAVLRVMKSGMYLMGPELAAFEKELAHFIKIKYAIGVKSGTDALTLAIKALGLGKNDEVIVPANVYPTVFGVVASSVKIKLCDVEKDTLNVSVKTILLAITDKTKAIVAVHLYGLPAPMPEIMKLAKRKKIFVIEDCAQAVGARIKGRHVGTFGEIGCFSFYPTKNLAAMGDGGAIVTDSKVAADRIKRLRMYGEEKRYHSVEISTHSRLDEIQSAILRVRLKNLAWELADRRKLANIYKRRLPINFLIPKFIPDNVKHAYHLFVIKTKNRDELKEFLTKKEIETGIHYPSPIHFQPAFKYLGYKKGNFPAAEQTSRQVLSLPFYPDMSFKKQETVITSINEFLKSK